MIPGEYILKKEDLTLNAKHTSITVKVINTGDRPIQIGSHFHFFEVNKMMSFDREKAFGRRLDIPSGTAKRFEPGESTEVNLIEISGDKKAFGANNLTQGDINSSTLEEAMKKVEQQYFKNDQL